MNRAKNYFLFAIFTLLISGSVISCGSGGGDNSSSTTVNRETVTLRGSVADNVARNISGEENFLTAGLKDLFTIVHSSHAQEGQVLEGILVEAFDGETKVGEDLTDETGEFVIEGVPCNVPITLVFTYEGNEVVLDGISAPCMDMTEEGVVSMVVSLNFNEEEAEVEQIEEEEPLQDAALSCSTDIQEIDMNGEEYMIDGGGNGCIITAGNCDLNIRASSVVLLNCSTCIDTRGGSSVNILATDFECVANNDGISTVGNSAVDITVIASDMADDTVMPSDAQVMQHMGDSTLIGSGNGNILIISGQDGADLRGTSNLTLHAFVDGTTMSSEIRGDVSIEGVTSSIVAVGNADASVEAENCFIDPDAITKGAAQIELNCGEESTTVGNGPQGNGPPEHAGPPDNPGPPENPGPPQ